jgi:hypothetical protein
MRSDGAGTASGLRSGAVIGRRARAALAARCGSADRSGGGFDDAS